MTESTNYEYLVPAPCVIFALIFLIFGIFSLIRLKYIISADKLFYKIAVAFYLIILLTCILRIIAFLYIAFSTSQIITLFLNQQTILTLLYFPDAFFWMIFLILIFRLIYLFYETHTNRNNTFINLIQPKSYKCLLLILIIYSIIEIIFVILFNTNVVDLNKYIFQNALLNIFLPISLLFVEIYLHLKYSGIPYISLLASNNKGVLNKGIFVWALLRTYHGIWSVYVAFSYPDMYTNLSNGKNIDLNNNNIIIILCLNIVDIVLTEFLPFLICFDINFVLTFFQIRNDLEEIFIKKNEECENLNETIHTSSIYGNENFINYKNIKFYENLENNKFKKKDGFGNIELCNFNDNSYICRIIKLKEINNYLTEEFLIDFQKIKELQKKEKKIRPILYYSIFQENNEKFIYILYEYYKNGNLSNLLISKGLSEDFKLKISLEICKIMNFFHSMNPPLIHGHLNPNNILFDFDFSVKIDDFFFISIKKYYTLMTSYCYKTQYTAPEFLLDKNRFVFKPTIAGDIYSLGMILYEIFANLKPFDNISLKENIKNVCEEKLRPKIPENVHQKISNLIRCCWQDDPGKRPEIKQIINVLENLI